MKQKLLLSLTITFISLVSIAQTVTEVPTPPPLDTLNKVFSKVEVEAHFPGGDAAWIRYLTNNLDANIPITNRAKKGTYQVIVRFIVSKDGTISDVYAETKYGHGMEKEVIRVIKEGPNWAPAMQNGRKVNAYRRQPVTFVVSD